MSPELRHDLRVLARAARPVLAIAALLVALAMNACAPPPPDGRLVDANAALAAVLEIYTGRQVSPSELAPVYIVQPDPECIRELNYVAFKDSGMCVAGLTLDLSSIYLVDEAPGAFSTRLPHEAMHLLGGAHPGLLTWAPGSPEAKQIAVAQAYLLAHPELNRIGGGGR